MASLILFEDETVPNLLPLVWLRPVWALRCGIWTLQEAVEAAYGHRADGFWVRPFLRDVVRERTGRPVNEWAGGEMVLLLNGRLLAEQGLPRHVPMFGEPRRFVAKDGTLLGAWLPGRALHGGWPTAALAALPAVPVRWPLLEWPWELVQYNTPRLAAQAATCELGSQPRELPGVHRLRPDAIFIHPSATVRPGVVLDASGGPIIIEAGATVMANAVIQGPSWVGPKSAVKIGAKIYHGTSIGPQCKVGGEVEETIFQGYTNKQHDGFLGHSFLGEWCNLGADTNTSDLKNNYGTVTLWAGGAYRDTGSLFVGLFMGDHSKTGINTMLNTGTVVGIACNLFGGGYPPRFVPSFSWGGAEGLTEHRPDKALETAERVMARRTVPLTDAEQALLAHVFRETAGERVV